MQDPQKHNQVLSDIERVHRVVDEMLEPFGKESMRGDALSLHEVPPFDLSKPNQHNSKAEFLQEKELVEQCLEHLENLKDLLLATEKDADRSLMLEKFRPHLDAQLRSITRRIQVQSSFSLVRKNFADAGASYSSLFVFADLARGFRERLRELLEQEERFWNLNHRAPGYYAREIALRLARLYVRETKVRPTVGTSPVDGSPSTGYSRALGKTFKILGIKARPRKAAEWAIGQLTDADFNPPQSLLDEEGLPKDMPAKSPQEEIENALMEGKK